MPVGAVGSVVVPVEVPVVVVAVGSVVVVVPVVVVPVAVPPVVVVPAVEPSEGGAVDVEPVVSGLVEPDVVPDPLVVPVDPLVDELDPVDALEALVSVDGLPVVPVDVLGAAVGEASTVGSVCVCVRPGSAFFLVESADFVVDAARAPVGAPPSDR